MWSCWISSFFRVSSYTKRWRLCRVLCLMREDTPNSFVCFKAVSFSVTWPDDVCQGLLTKPNDCREKGGGNSKIVFVFTNAETWEENKSKEAKTRVLNYSQSSWSLKGSTCAQSKHIIHPAMNVSIFINIYQVIIKWGRKQWNLL